MTMLGGLLLPISSRMKQFPGKQQTVKVERHMGKEAVYPSSADQQTDPTAPIRAGPKPSLLSPFP